MQRRGIRLPRRVRQFIHGLTLPFHLARALLAAPEARRLYLRVGVLQTLAALVLALTLMSSGNQVELAPPWWTVKGFSLMSLAFWVSLFAALQLSQWVVIALSRDYHTAITREASLLNGVEPEDEPLQPHVRLNVPWLRSKLKRRWRALMLFVVGLPAVAFLTLPFQFSQAALTALGAAWGAWWLVVFTAAKSSRAWEPPTAPRPPWFLRAWTWLTTRVPGLRWGVLQRYGAAWARRTEEVFAPVATVERHPWAYAGLALTRFVCSFPPLKFFVRPLIPVASAHLLSEEAPASASPPSTPEAPAGPDAAPRRSTAP